MKKISFILLGAALLTGVYFLLYWAGYEKFETSIPDSSKLSGSQKSFLSRIPPPYYLVCHKNNRAEYSLLYIIGKYPQSMLENIEENPDVMKIQPQELFSKAQIKLLSNLQTKEYKIAPPEFGKDGFALFLDKGGTVLLLENGTFIITNFSISNREIKNYFELKKM